MDRGFLLNQTMTKLNASESLPLPDLDIPVPPIVRTDEEISLGVQDCHFMLADPDVDHEINAGIKEGYLTMLDIFLKGKNSYEVLNDVENLQARAMGILAIDYLRGEQNLKVLTAVSFKKP